MKTLSNIRFILTVIAIALMTACEHRPLIDPGNVHYVRVYVDTTLLNVTTGFYNAQNVRPEFSRPDIMRFMLCDRNTGALVAERYLRTMGEDEKGIYYEGHIACDPGEYDMVVYNFNTPYTTIRNEYSFHEIEAYTNPAAIHAMGSGYVGRSPENIGRLVYQPDHLFRSAIEGVQVNVSGAVDTLRNSKGDFFRAESIVKSYYIQLYLRGAQFVSTVSGYMTGMGGSARLHGPVPNLEDPVSHPLEMIYGDQTVQNPSEKSPEDGGGAEDDSIIYTTFHTFGKLPDETTDLHLAFDIITKDGRGFTVDLDITEEFGKPTALEKQWILLNKVIIIPEAEPDNDGGFRPGVEEWIDASTDIVIW